MVAQEAVRMSLAGATSAEARRKAVTTLGYYNVRLGPAAARFQAGFGVTFTDNASYYYSSQAQPDLILSPTLDTRIWWPLTEKNSLSLSLGGGYYKYIKIPELDRPFVNSGSELAFDVYAGDFLINLHERFSLTGQTYQNPAAGTGSSYTQLENALGTTINWDLNKLIVTAGYDHVNYITLQSNFPLPDGQAEIFWARGGLALAPGSVVGLEAGTTFLTYDNQINPGAASIRGGQQYNAGVFYALHFSQYLDLKANAGYTILKSEVAGPLGLNTTDSSFYGELAVHHRVNEKLEHSLSGGRTVDLGLRWGVYSRLIEYYYARWNTTWKIVRNVQIGTRVFYENGSELSYITDNFERLGGGISIGRPITQKLSVSLGYDYYRRRSSLPAVFVGRSYTVNNVSLLFNYNF